MDSRSDIDGRVICYSRPVNQTLLKVDLLSDIDGRVICYSRFSFDTDSCNNLIPLSTGRVRFYAWCDMDLYIDYDNRDNTTICYERYMDIRSVC